MQGRKHAIFGLFVRVPATLVPEHNVMIFDLTTFSLLVMMIFHGE